LHFMSVAGFLMDSVASVNATGEAVLNVSLDNLTIPRYAKALAVVAANSNAKAGRSKAAVAEIDDYGVPKFSPGAVSWGGDVDGRADYISGRIHFQRAASEKSITHYNLYWKDANSFNSFVGKVPATGFSTPSCEGDCEFLDMNVSADVYTFRRGAYTDNEMAVISFSGPATIFVTSFRTEKYYDYLEVGGTQLTGTRLVLPMRIDVGSGPQRITWSSDRSETEEGWAIELVQTGSVAEYSLSSVQPQSWGVEVRSAYTWTENPSSSTGSLTDFDAATMPPSPALRPRELRFVDTDIEQYMIQGQIQFLPAANCTGSVTFYSVSIADDIGVAVQNFHWHLQAPANCSTLLSVSVDTMALPPLATQIIVTPGNPNGEGSSASVPLHDIVRSPPANASFTGDEDPALNQVKGSVRIMPAENPAGILSYAIYFANGTQKEKLLGRVSAAFDQPVTYDFHVIVQTSLRTLLVVSVYADMEMDSGVSFEFEDLYVANDFFFHPDGRALSMEQEPWLQRRPPSREVQLLWTESAKVGSNKKKTAPSVAGDKRLMGWLALPGVLSSATSTSSQPVFVPPSLATRKALASAFAEVLPSVSQEQLRLTKGEMMTCETVMQSVSQKGPAGACLVIHFEVLPDASIALDPRYAQDFLDRVEARLILLSRTNSASEKMNRLLTTRLGTFVSMPPSGIQAVLGEPQQVAPKLRPARSLAVIEESDLQLIAWDDEPEGEQEAGPVIWSVSTGALLGAISAVSLAATRVCKMRKDLRDLAAAAVDPVQPSADATPDVSVQLTEQHQ